MRRSAPGAAARGTRLVKCCCTTTRCLRRLFPNADFYSALVYDAMGFPVEMFPVLFAIPRTASWMAQWAEMVIDPEQDVARPRQVYTGLPLRPYVPVEQREQLGALETAIHGRL
jgi:citrate synthase